MHPRFNRILRSALLGSRWGMAPFCLGLIAVLLLLLVQFFRELGHLLTGFEAMEGPDVILAALKLVDLVFVGNLVVMIIGAAVEVFLPRALHRDDDETVPIETLDFSGLKLRVFASLGAITAIHLLERVLNIDAVDKSAVLWEILILLSFIASGVLLALMDRLETETD